MLTLPPFTYHAPKTVSEAVALLGQHKLNAKLIAGGTDLVPNMKHRLFTPDRRGQLRGARWNKLDLSIRAIRSRP